MIFEPAFEYLFSVEKSKKTRLAEIRDKERHGDTQVEGSKGMLEDKPLQGRNQYMDKMSESFIMSSWNIRFTGGLMPCCLLWVSCAASA